MEIFLATRRYQQQSKHGPKRQVQQHCGGKRWFATRVCAVGCSRGSHATQPVATVAPSQSSRQRRHAVHPRNILLLPTATYNPPKSTVLIVRVANVHQPTTAATVAAVRSPIRPRPTVARCGIDWPSCPSSERRGRSNIRTVVFSSFSSFLFRIAFFLFRFVTFIWMILKKRCMIDGSVF